MQVEVEHSSKKKLKLNMFRVLRMCNLLRLCSGKNFYVNTLESITVNFLLKQTEGSRKIQFVY